MLQLPTLVLSRLIFLLLVQSSVFPHMKEATGNTHFISLSLVFYFTFIIVSCHAPPPQPPSFILLTFLVLLSHVQPSVIPHLPSSTSIELFLLSCISIVGVMLNVTFVLSYFSYLSSFLFPTLITSLLSSLLLLVINY